MASAAAADPQDLPGVVVPHDPYAPLPGPVGISRIIERPAFENADVWNFTLRLEVFAARGYTQEAVIELVDRYMVGERGPHIPVIIYTIDEEGEERASGVDEAD